MLMFGINTFCSELKSKVVHFIGSKPNYSYFTIPVLRGAENTTTCNNRTMPQQFRIASPIQRAVSQCQKRTTTKKQSQQRTKARRSGGKASGMNVRNKSSS